MLGHPPTRPAPGPRHTTDWYESPGREKPGFWPGQKMLIPCDGGPSISRLDVYPPLLEVPERDGTYVLEDEGPVQQWHYRFVPAPT